MPPLCLLVVYYAVYSYVCPYCSTLANTLEVVLLGSFIVLLHVPFLPLSSSYHVTTTDTCGHPVLSTSVVSSLMAALYYCTLVLSVVAMVTTACMNKTRQAAVVVAYNVTVICISCMHVHMHMSIPSTHT